MNSSSRQIPMSPLEGFLNELSYEKQAIVSIVVDDNAKRHRDENLENSFSRLPPTPSGSFQRRQMNRWNDSFEINENNNNSFNSQQQQPRTHPSSGGKLSPTNSDLQPPSRRKSRASISDMIAALPMDNINMKGDETDVFGQRPPLSRW